MTIDEAIDKFLADLALGQAEKTVRTYAGALNRFREYLDQVPLPPPPRSRRLEGGPGAGDRLRRRRLAGGAGLSERSSGWGQRAGVV